MWCGFAIFWEASVLNTKAPGLFALWGIPFVLIGIYFVIGRFLADALRRSRTFYGLTDQRVVIVGGLLGRPVKSLDLATLPALQLAERSDRSGTISFGTLTGSTPEWMAGSWPGAASQLPPRFEMIEEARSVYDRVREAQRATRVVGA
jgi:hypothetical protein